MAVHLLTTEEVAERFRTSPATVRYWRHIGLVVEHAAADAHPGGADADVAPVPDGGRARAEPVGHLFGGQQLDGHGSSRGDGDEIRTNVRHREKAPIWGV